ncbi:MAG TPA: hypothetical protein VIL28_11305 [Steroidobacteraceae bacterium]
MSARLLLEEWKLRCAARLRRHGHHPGLLALAAFVACSGAILTVIRLAQFESSRQVARRLAEQPMLMGFVVFFCAVVLVARRRVWLRASPAC